MLEGRFRSLFPLSRPSASLFFKALSAPSPAIAEIFGAWLSSDFEFSGTGTSTLRIEIRVNLAYDVPKEALPLWKNCSFVLVGSYSARGTLDSEDPAPGLLGKSSWREVPLTPAGSGIKGNAFRRG